MQKRWFLVVFFLFMLLLLRGAEASTQAEVTLTPLQAAAFEGGEWEGYAPVFWRETYAPQDDADRALATRPGAFAIMRRGDHNILCLLEHDGEWQVVARSDSLLPSGTLGGEYGPPHISGVSIDTFDILLEIEDRGDWDEGMGVQNRDGVRTVTAFYQLGADGMYSSTYLLPSGEIELRWQGDEMNQVMILPEGSIDCSFEAFDRQAVLECLATEYAARNGPRYLPRSGKPDSLPQAQVIDFKKGQTYEVYTGPGKQYARAGDDGRANASVTTNDWIQVLGREGDWLLIQYNLNDYRNRIGYITASALPGGVAVSGLSFDAREAVLLSDTWVTDDPLRNVSEIATFHLGDEVRWLATMGEDWIYVEGENEYGTPIRGFVHREAVSLRSAYAGMAVVHAAGDAQRAFIYAQADANAPEGFYYNGTLTAVLSRDDVWSKVRITAGAAAYEGYIRNADLAFSKAPVDVPSHILAAEVFRREHMTPVILRDRPAENGEQLGEVWNETEIEVLGEIGGWSHMRSPYREEGGFIPAAEIMPLPARRVYDEAYGYIARGGATLRLAPDEASASLMRLYEGMRIGRGGEAGEWLFVYNNLYSMGKIKGYILKEECVAAQGTDAAPATLPVARVSIATPGEFGPLAYLREQPSENAGQIYPFADGALALVLGETGTWRYVQIGSSHGFFPANLLEETGALENALFSTYAGWATAVPAEGGKEVLLYQFPGEDMAYTWQGLDRTEVGLLADLGDWWQVEVIDAQAFGFIPASCLEDIMVLR